MPVNAGHAALMLDTDGVAEFSGPSRLLNPSVSHCFHGGAVLRDKVHPDVGPVGMKQGMISMESETGRNVFEIDRKTEELRSKRPPLLIIQMSVSVLVAESKCLERSRPETYLRRFHIANQMIRPVAADLLLVNQLHARPGLQVVEPVTVAEGIQQRLDDRRRHSMPGSRTFEVLLDLKGKLDRLDVVLDRLRRCLNNHIAKIGDGNRSPQIQIVLEATQLASLRVFIESKGMVAMEDSGIGDALEHASPSPCLIGVNPGILEV